MSKCCPKVCHDKKQCVKECSGKKCVCVRNTDCDKKKKDCKKCKGVKYPCDMPCDGRKVIDMLEVHVCVGSNDCRPWCDTSKIYDPLAAFEKCAKPPCLHNLPPCDCACPMKKCHKSCSSSSSSSSEECECYVVPSRKICEECTDSDSSSKKSDCKH